MAHSTCPEASHRHLLTVTDCGTGVAIVEVEYPHDAGFVAPDWKLGATGTFIVSTACLHTASIVHATMVRVLGGRTIAHHAVPQARGH